MLHNVTRQIASRNDLPKSERRRIQSIVARSIVRRSDFPDFPLKRRFGVRGIPSRTKSAAIFCSKDVC